MEHFAFPRNLDFAADDQGAFLCTHYSRKAVVVIHRLVKQCLSSVNHEQFPVQMTQLHAQQVPAILAEEDFTLKLLRRTPIKIHRRADRRRQPRNREHRLAQRTQRGQHSDHKRVQRQRQNSTITS